jgi:hypothetical protein
MVMGSFFLVFRLSNLGLVVKRGFLLYTPQKVIEDEKEEEL